MSPVTVILYTPDHRDAWAAMRAALYAEENLARVSEEIDEITRAGTMNAQPYACLIAVDPDGLAVGFIEVSLRSTAEECTTSPVAYIESWFVAPDARRRGVGRALIEAACAWGRAQGCREIGSDTQSYNERSCSAHLALGFEDAGLVRHFRRSL